jgi:gentisate 1,2-dioxygenase
MNARHNLENLENACRESAKPYLEFLRVPDLSAGLYVLGAGASDPQSPHGEDELHVVLSERARIQIGAEDFPANAGDSLFVPARVPHQFHIIFERLKSS